MDRKHLENDLRLIVNLHLETEKAINSLKKIGNVQEVENLINILQKLLGKWKVETLETKELKDRLNLIFPIKGLVNTADWEDFFLVQKSVFYFYLNVLFENLNQGLKLEENIIYLLEVISDMAYQYFMLIYKTNSVLNLGIEFKTYMFMTMRQNTIDEFYSIKRKFFSSKNYEPRDLIPLTAFELRLLIEKKLKYAFGLLYVVDRNKSQLIDVQISYFVKFYDSVLSRLIRIADYPYVKHILQWSNNYIHTGVFPYYWQPYYALELIRTFVFGYEGDDTGVSINSGICIKDLDELRREFEAFLKGKLKKANLDFIYSNSVESVPCGKFGTNAL